MDTELLTQLGLNELQAKAYITLVKNGPTRPNELATKIKTTRTNAYSVLDKLVELGLAKKVHAAKKIHYRAEHPTNLEKLVNEQRKAASEREGIVKQVMPALLNYFYTYSEQPGVRFYVGKDGIEEMYSDQLRTNKPITMVRTTADLQFFGGFEQMSKIREKFNKSSISRHMFTPDSPEARTNWQEHDAASGNTRTWLKTEDYTAAAEWAVYGDKVAIISFGEEAMGMIIESPQIAEALRQILALLDKGLQLDPEYEKLPQKARYSVTKEVS